MKKCARCGVEQEPSNFAKDRTRPDGLQAYCSPCLREYRQANRVRLAEANRAWRAANPGKVQEARRRSRARPEVRAQRAAYNKEWKASNQGKVREQGRRSYERHADERRAAARAARMAAPETHRERAQRWREENKDKVSAYRRDNRQQDRDYYAKSADLIREKKEARREWCVYRIDFSDGRFYIGSSCHYELRFNKHKSLARHGEHVAALSCCDFESATMHILAACKNEPDALDLEGGLIKEAMAVHPQKCLNKSVPARGSKLYWVYVIQSRTGPFYVGMTTDPARRLREHNGVYKNGEPGNPNGGRYTAKHRPWTARALYGPYDTRSEALRAEYCLKRQKRGVGRLRWTPEDSPLCRGEGPEHPWVQKPAEWPPTSRN